ncbi:MAG: hypothetical protein H8E41_02030 [Desulfobulbaceae bacterium]|uniref:Uncharacterized protein n=1 Tax=Candidatus Desulfobia pelagia TaxID=2841692 RepID=A0A8J6TEP0_9BACT|nr:hypothetical protein [Candidatus Desulfobia pelagia]
MGFKDVLARLNSMAAGQEFHFLCVEKMAGKMDQVVILGGGEILKEMTDLRCCHFC